MYLIASGVVGSVVYFLIRAIVLQLGMDANDMKMLSAIIVALAILTAVVSTFLPVRNAAKKKPVESIRAL